MRQEYIGWYWKTTFSKSWEEILYIQNNSKFPGLSWQMHETCCMYYYTNWFSILIYFAVSYRNKGARTTENFMRSSGQEDIYYMMIWMSGTGRKNAS